MYGSCVYVYAFTLHACMCMHVRYMRVRVCMYGTCVYAFTLHACTCMHVWYLRIFFFFFFLKMYIYIDSIQMIKGNDKEKCYNK